MDMNRGLLAGLGDTARALLGLAPLDRDSGAEAAAPVNEGPAATAPEPVEPGRLHVIEESEMTDTDNAAAEQAAREAAVAATKAANDRWAAVLTSPAAEGRTRLAVSLLVSSDMSAEAIVAALECAAPSPSGSLSARMSDEGNPNVSAGRFSGDGEGRRMTWLGDLAETAGIASKKKGN